MKLLKLLVLVSGVLSSAALAQGANPYNGKWTVKFDGTSMANATGTVVIKDDQGTWKIVAHSTKNPCIGFEAPITVQRASDDELVFEVVRSKVLSGCEDSTLSLKRVDEKTLQGEFSDGRKVMMFRD